MFFSHGSIHSKGVCILLNTSPNCIVKNIDKDQIRRIISIDLNAIQFQCKESLCAMCMP